MHYLVQNKKASFNYFLEKEKECGLHLKGSEVKSLAKSKASLDGSYIIIKKNELWILNMHIAPYDHGSVFNPDPLRTRKLLLHKKEILQIYGLVQTQKYQIVPLKIYFKNNKIKLAIALGKPKKLHDKRESLKQKDLKRQIKKQIF